MSKTEREREHKVSKCREIKREKGGELNRKEEQNIEINNVKKIEKLAERKKEIEKEK